VGVRPTISNLKYRDRNSRNHSQSNQITVETNNFERNSGKESRTVYCRPVTRQKRSRAHKLDRKVDSSYPYQNCRKWNEQVRTDPRPQLLAHQCSNSKAIVARTTTPTVSSYGIPGRLIRKIRSDISL
jgi:hypothetical protein